MARYGRKRRKSRSDWVRSDWVADALVHRLERGVDLESLQQGGVEAFARQGAKLLLEDLDGRGLQSPRLAIIDGNGGLIKALKAVWPKVLRHRRTAHKTRNVLDCVPGKHQARVKKALGEIFHAPDIEDCLSFYKFPGAHWKRIRTSNVLERAFKEVRRRTRVVEHFPNERSALTLVWACLETDRMKWRGVRIDARLLQAVDQAAEDLARNPIRIESARKYLKAA